ncbi:gap junction delta-2 protein-like [Clavelina lepadiformis]|uniref:Gap junction protein n=1 Tax=Clavelina lepadiformis TaxID=159417 RepID=A0ABP0GRA7_CLALP
MAWHLLEKVIEQSSSHATILGKWWIACMFVFRIIVVASIGDTVYSDEQDEFICNTLQPGCKQVCYNKFAPISHIRFWAFQILATGTPSCVFIIYAMHKLALVPSKPGDENSKKDATTQTAWRSANSRKTKSKEKGSSSTVSSPLYREIEIYDCNSKKREPSSVSTPPPQYEKVCRETKVKRTKLVVLKAYVINVILRTIIEAGFMFLQFLLYQFHVPEIYDCERDPCPKIVECYISRPKEKTIFLYFMFVVAGVCLCINIVEMQYLGWLRIRRILRKGNTPSLDSTDPERVISVDAEAAPPGYYIPDVDPPSEKYRSPNTGFPHIRLRAASFTTSESDVTTDDTESIGSHVRLAEEAARRYLS